MWGKQIFLNDARASASVGQYYSMTKRGRKIEKYQMGKRRKVRARLSKVVQYDGRIRLVHVGPAMAVTGGSGVV